MKKVCIAAKFIVPDEFEPGKCDICPFFYKTITTEECKLGFKSHTCPLEDDTINIQYIPSQPSYPNPYSPFTYDTDKTTCSNLDGSEDRIIHSKDLHGPHD